MRTLVRSSFLFCAAVALAATTLLAGDAHACGGTFCDGGPAATPVDQTGENILFVMDGEFTEAHIQIQYSGDAHRFAWIIPMPVIPTIHVGSQPLFTNLLQASVPTYQLKVNQKFCGNPSSGCFGGDEEAFDDSGGTFGESSGAGGSSAGGGPTVVLQKAVGAFDVTVLQGGTAKEVQTWLDDNGYGSTAETPALLEDYVKQSYIFVAVKLEPGAGVNQIHPIVLRYASEMPCIPIRLTRVAAVDNMSIRAFFLGHARVYPENYALVDVNQEQIDWINAGKNYDQVVSGAIDEAPGHHGFVVEYAGSSAVVLQNGVFDIAWTKLDFSKSPPENTVELLGTAALMSCTPDSCTFNHPLIQPLLEEYLPAPKGQDETSWYASLALHKDEIDMTKWNGPAFEKDYQERIVDPGQHAAKALDDNPYLTRMLTRLSPAEMDLDPTFVQRPDLAEPNVSATHVATETIPCNDTATVKGGGVDKVVVKSAWPTFTDMPFAKQVLSVPAKGDPKVVTDNTAKIEDAVTTWNDAAGIQASGGCATGGKNNGPAPAFFATALAVLLIRRRRDKSAPRS
jgi:uncharacterized protein (TIGR03382 family)